MGGSVLIEFGEVALTALEKEDLPRLQSWRNNWKFRQYFREYRELSLVDQTRWYESISAPNSVHHMFAVRDTQSHEVIGAAGLCYIHWAYRNADLSFYIGKDDLYADPIFGKATVLALLKYGFMTLNLERIWCELYETDSLKIGLLKSLGFTLDGTLRKSAFKNGAFVNGHIFSVLKEEGLSILSSAANKA
jgi:RimJ/RimL family protein N-acetyltransferase